MILIVVMAGASVLDRRVDDGETLLILPEGDAGDSEHAA
jgi:hypothetical protein